MARKKVKKFIEKAIKREGALTKRVGGPPGENVPKVRELAKKPGLSGQQARFFLNVLRPAVKKKRKSLIGER